ncbi:hypothetical protein AXG93_879s1050 [Marchantia polymorpha subsp. ruderalis]|uniref:Uncharacterized protein n=1 Tax=Marchantia polymorpha subsp. ruderalis TaxID=1480154 RepID=A0A176WTS1_MARPO|nr:hypothetical protein AXG93_879s1050 [Marchantia polymorpha subsp. ruderalis]
MELIRRNNIPVRRPSSTLISVRHEQASSLAGAAIAKAMHELACPPSERETETELPPEMHFRPGPRLWFSGSLARSRVILPRAWADLDDGTLTFSCAVGPRNIDGSGRPEAYHGAGLAGSIVVGILNPSPPSQPFHVGKENRPSMDRWSIQITRFLPGHSALKSQDASRQAQATEICQTHPQAAV